MRKKKTMRIIVISKIFMMYKIKKKIKFKIMIRNMNRMNKIKSNKIAFLKQNKLNII